MGEDASEERSLFERSRESTAAYVAGDLGVVRVDLAPDRIGEFSLVERYTARGVAAGRSLVAVATPEAVLLNRGEGFEDGGFGPAVAVGVDGRSVLAASPDGAVGRLDLPNGDADAEWEAIGTVSAPRRFDGALLAAGDGVYRAADGLTSLGSAAARDVAAAGPYAATDEGLFRHAGGEWHREHDTLASAVAADGERAHAITDAGVLERADESESAGDRWERLATPGHGHPVDLAHGPGLYAVTGTGEFLIAAEGEQATDGRGGWRSRTLGVRGVTGLAVLG